MIERRQALPRAGLDALRELNRSLRSVHPAPQADGSGAQGGSVPPMRSVQRFSRTWARWATQDRVDRALRDLPGNAGPLNSQRLAARALQRLQALSPAYVSQLLAQLDAYQLVLSGPPSTGGGVPVTLQAAAAATKPRLRGRRAG